MNNLFSVESTDLGYIFRIFGIKIRLRKQLNNRLYLISPDGKKRKAKSVKGLKIKFYGRNNVVEIEQPVKFQDSILTLSGSENRVKIGSSKYCLKELKIYCADNSEITAGRNLSTSGCSIAAAGAEKMKVTIGDNCMFGANVYIRPADGHTILDKTTGEILNDDRKEIIIGNHVWLGRNTSVTKGSVIPDDTIAGINSLINKKFEETNTILAGSPAKVIKRNILWNEKSIPEYRKTIKNDL